MSYFPLKWKPRKEQETIVDFFSKSVKDKKKFILIDAPVGVGKSFAAVLMAEWYKTNIHKYAKFDIITNTKILQTQYTNEFNFIKSLWGKNNYQCAIGGMTCEEGCEMGVLHQNQCSNCPYKSSYKEFIEADINITNFHMFCTFAIYVQSIIEKRHANVLFIDEAHDFDETFCNFVTLTLSEIVIKKWDLSTQLTQSYQNRIKNIQTNDDFYNIITDAINDISIRLADMRLSSYKKKCSKEQGKKISALARTLEKYVKFIADWPLTHNNWILEQTEEWENKSKKISYHLEPIWSSIYLKNLVWDNYDYVVYMSGTILDKSLFCSLNGISEEETAHIKIDSPFPIDNRKIYYKKQGKMSYTEKTATWKKYIPFIKKIMDYHSDQKGIIHTNSFELAEWLKRDIQSKRLLFHTKDDKNDILEQHRISTLPTILVSPSMENGIDLKDDLSRFQIILKVPFPSLASKRTKRRMELMPNWYNWKTTIDIVQSYGRSIRSETDWATTYILDESFDVLIKHYNGYFPKYFTEAFK
jgi:Rad3-related DNA helicase